MYSPTRLLFTLLIGKKDKAATIGGLQLLNISEDQISLSSLQQTITLPKPAPQTEAHRFMPVSDLISATYEGQILSESQEDIRPANAVSTFDSETIALWEQFMNDDPAKQQGPIIPGINEELLVPPTCPCPHDSCCRICPPDGTNIPTPQSSTSPANRFANCTGFDCCDLMVAISRIAEEVLAAGNDPAPLRSKSMRGSTLAQAQLSSDQDLPVSDLSNWPILEDEAASQLRSEPFAAGLGFDTSFPVLCTYESDCDCAVCPSKSPATGFSRDEEEYCVACVFCIKTSTID